MILVNKKHVIIQLITLIVVCGPSLVWAHKVNILASLENSTVLCESFYQDGKPVADGSYAVTDQHGAITASGKTNANGLFQFPYEPGLDVKISLSTLLGHNASMALSELLANEPRLPVMSGDKSLLIKVVVGIVSIFSFFGLASYLMSKKNNT